MKKVVSAVFVAWLLFVLLGLTPPTRVLAQTTNWNVKWYSDPNLCSTADCSPPQVYCEQSNIPGGWFHIDYPADGRACNTGNDRWGSIWKSTFSFPEGDYVFHSDHDDSVKVFVNGNSVMDVGGSENDNKACPAIHLSGNTSITVIHKNEGGGAKINVWWDTNTTPCNPTQTNHVWVTKDASNTTRVILENGDANTANLYLARNGQANEITKSRWYSVSNGIQADIPADVISFLVDKGSVPIISGNISDEWYNSSADPHWVTKKRLSLWTDGQNQTHLTYRGEHGRPTIRFYSYGVSGEQSTTTIWSDMSDGSGIDAILPDSYESVMVDRWIKPAVDQSITTIWFENSYWVIKKTVTITINQNNKTKISYYRGSSIPVTLKRGDTSETRTDLWQTEVINGQTNYFVILPADITAFQIQGGPKPRIIDWANWFWGNGESRWVNKKTTTVSKSGNITQVFYANPDAAPAQVNIFYYLHGDSTERQTISWWTETNEGLIFTVPNNVDSFLVSRGPAPIILGSAATDWKTISSDGLWVGRKSIFNPTPTPTPTQVTTTILVKARAIGAGTQMRLGIGNRYTKTVNVSNTLKNYTFTVPFVVSNIDKIRVSLVNGSININAPTKKLEVVSLTVNGITRHTKSESNIFSVGAKKGSNKCQSLTLPIQTISLNTDWLFCKGWFEFR